jgi:hypothetical protein
MPISTTGCPRRRRLVGRIVVHGRPDRGPVTIQAAPPIGAECEGRRRRVMPAPRRTNAGRATRWPSLRRAEDERSPPPGHHERRHARRRAADVSSCEPNASWRACRRDALPRRREVTNRGRRG